MRKSVVAVFAHPDDESFGPGGTLAKLSKTHDVTLITVTDGEAGYCSIDQAHQQLADIRKKELHNAAKVLEIKALIFLGYKDATLSNGLYHDIASKIGHHLTHLKPEIVITFGLEGVSGHLDHIAVSFMTTYAVRKCTPTPQLWYYHLDEEQYRQREKDYFIYFPHGIKKSAADKVIDVSDVWDKKIEAIKSHASQRHDGNKLLKILDHHPKEEYFTLLKD